MRLVCDMLLIHERRETTLPWSTVCDSGTTSRIHYSVKKKKKEGKILDIVQYTPLLCSSHSSALPSPYFTTNIFKVMAFENSSDAKWTNLKDTY